MFAATASSTEQLPAIDLTDCHFLSSNRLDKKKGSNSLSATIFREKKNPLSSTRLSCYQPIKPQIEPAHYKSVDNFMFLNTINDELNALNTEMFINCRRTHKKLTRSPLLPATPLPSDHIQQQQHQLRPKTTPSSSDQHDESYGFAPSATCLPPTKTKSVDNLCNQIEEEIIRQNSETIAASSSSSKKRVTSLSNRIRVMSSRTQRLFHRFVQGKAANQSEQNDDFTMLRSQLPESLTTCKSRRSLSYGNLPDIDDFNLNLEAASISTLQDAPLADDVKTDIGDMVTKRLDTLGSFERCVAELANIPDDADSGILVNESGQSSIIETELREVGGTEPRDGKEVCTNEIQPAIMEYKCVRIRMSDVAVAERRLLVSVAPIARSADSTIRIGYVVTTIHAGGLISR